MTLQVSTLGRTRQLSQTEPLERIERPSGHLRFVERTAKGGDRKLRILQQRWDIRDEAGLGWSYEWRDVPVIQAHHEEQGGNYGR